MQKDISLPPLPDADARLLAINASASITELIIKRDQADKEFADAKIRTDKLKKRQLDGELVEDELAIAKQRESELQKIRSEIGVALIKKRTKLIKESGGQPQN